MRFILISSLLLSICASSHAGLLWGKAEVASSLNTVKNAYPEGKVVEPTEMQKLKSGAALRFQLDDVPVNNDLYRASFYFKNDALDQVTLSTENKEGVIACDAKYAALHSALSGKYGAPVDVQGHIPSKGIAQSTFASGSLNVSTFAMSTSRNCAINIFYTDKSGGPAANL